MTPVSEGAAPLSEKIERFAATENPPASPVRPVTIKAAGRNTRIASVALVIAPILLIVLVKMIGGHSFMGDVLTMGLIGFLFIGVIYALSTWTSVYMASRTPGAKDKWVAVGVLEFQKNYDDGIPVDMIHLELRDGRRVTVKTNPEIAARIQPGLVGWATLKNSELLKFA